LGGTALRRATEREQAARLGVAEAELAGLERRVQAQARAALQQRAAAERSAVDLARAAAQWQQSAAALARGYALGEGSLAEVLAARRLAGEQQAAAAQARVDAWQAGLQIALETGQLWPAPVLAAGAQADDTAEPVPAGRP
jgi:outer membrane protein TolC